MRRSPAKENNGARGNVTTTMSTEERAERYFDLLNENLKLKKEVREQELNIKK